MTARAFAFTPEPERASGVHLRPKLVGANIEERMLFFLRSKPGSTTAEVQEALRLNYPANRQLANLKVRGLVRAEHEPSRRGKIARWWPMSSTSEALIREGERRERERWVKLLEYEARGRTPIVSDVLLSIARAGEAGTLLPETE